MKGVSDIGEQQIKHTRLRTKARHYRAMAAAIQVHDEATIATFPKYVPRGRPISWYLERAEQAERASEMAGEMASLLGDMEHRNYLDRMTVEQKCERIETAAKEVIFWIEHYILDDLPQLFAGLSREQKQGYQRLFTGIVQRLTNAFKEEA
jgi:hypothetical protein